MKKLATLGVLVVTAAACVTVETAPANWQTTLQGQADRPARVAANATSVGNRTAVSVAVSGSTANRTHPWHVHRGTCSNDLGIVGPAEAYPPLRTGSNGQASATATVNVPLTAGGSYFVNVHASPQDLGTIVACAPLVRG